MSTTRPQRYAVGGAMACLLVIIVLFGIFVLGSSLYAVAPILAGLNIVVPLGVYTFLLKVIRRQPHVISHEVYYVPSSEGEEGVHEVTDAEWAGIAKDSAETDDDQKPEEVFEEPPDNAGNRPPEIHDVPWSLMAQYLALSNLNHSSLLHGESSSGPVETSEEEPAIIDSVPVLDQRQPDGSTEAPESDQRAIDADREPEFREEPLDSTPPLEPMESADKDNSDSKPVEFTTDLTYDRLMREANTLLQAQNVEDAVLFFEMASRAAHSDEDRAKALHQALVPALDAGLEEQANSILTALSTLETPPADAVPVVSDVLKETPHE